MKHIIIFLSLFCFCACAQLEPFEDMRREAGQVATVGQSSKDEPAICYNPLWHNLDQTQTLAEAACARTKRKAEFQKSTTFSCRLATPSTAFYKCQ